MDTFFVIPAAALAVGVILVALLRDRRTGETTWARARLRGEPWRLETPTTVSNLLRENPVGGVFLHMVICMVAFGFLAAENTLRWQWLPAAIVGITLGTIVWWLVLTAFAKGWIEDE